MSSLVADTAARISPSGVVTVAIICSFRPNSECLQGRPLPIQYHFPVLRGSDQPLMSRQSEKFLIGQSRKFLLTAENWKDGTNRDEPGGTRLAGVAEAGAGHLKYGAAVAGGIPVIPGLEQGLAGDRIVRIEGILNGTCNFILSKMEEGADYAPVLVAAQGKGYAEADPTEDVGGFDARAKLAILMRLALGVEVDLEEIAPLSITAILSVDFSY